MIDLKAFRKVNSITQIDLAEFLSIGQGFISQIEKGDRPLPKDYISKILANPYGWDTSMLTDSTENKTPALPSQDTMVERLLNLLAEKDKDMRTMLDILREKDEQINQLRRELDIRKKETASDVADSSFVNVG